MRFSIIIANYNSEKWIEKCIRSVEEQTYKDYEIIIVDDKSEDKSIEKIEEIAGKDERIRIIKNKTKRLNGGTRNEGIAEAKGEYIIFIDCDDWLKDERVLERIDKEIEGEDVIFIGYDFYTGRSNESIPRYMSIKEAIKDVTCAPWTKIMKSSIIKEVPFPEGTLYEDRIQHYRALLKCKTYKVIGESLYVWNRQNASSIVSSKRYRYYGFDYARELCFLIEEVEEEELKEYFKEELKGYMNRLNELAGEIYGE